MFKYFDIHSHTQFSAYDSDRDEVIKRALDAGVGVINVGTQKKTSEDAVALAHKYPEGVYAAVGLHPIHTHEAGAHSDDLETSFPSIEIDFDYNFYKKLAQYPKVVAMGECGLNYELGNTNYELEKDKRVKQREVFKRQIELAIEVDKPLMLHIRNAYEDTLEILNSYFVIHNSRLRGNVHFFAGDTDISKKFLDLGFTLSFTGVITYPKSKKLGMPDYEEIIRNTPIEMIMAETDAPYVAPMPHRGKRNEPAYVIEVYKKIAEIKGLDLEKVAGLLAENIKRVFKI